MRMPVFELHILPMMRASDREHMLSAFDLWDYDAVVEHAASIAQRVRVDMPTAATGGLWPDEWVALFERWRASGFKRLQLAAATYALASSGSRFVLTGVGTRPTAQHKVWLQLENATVEARTYVLYQEAPDADPGSGPVAFTVRERYPVTDGRKIFVRDGAGTHEVHAAAPTALVTEIASGTDRAFYGLDDEP